MSFTDSSGEKTDAHTTFLKNVEHFRSIDALPVELSFGINENASNFASHSGKKEIRKELFCQKNRAMDKLPLTEDAALLQHIRRAVYQAGIWTTSTQTQQVIPSPHDFAWNEVLESWVPVWMTIPEVKRSCRELIKCSCKGDCSNCKCGESQSGLLTTMQVQV
ncbi:hypothetical protein JTB14_034595 [Gonioctena quinquepunctata]|nr:hypothetical protein JTB14_034595 [Gonioctena quinquepunctata]